MYVRVLVLLAEPESEQQCIPQNMVYYTNVLNRPSNHAMQRQMFPPSKRETGTVADVDDRC